MPADDGVETGVVAAVLVVAVGDGVLDLAEAVAAGEAAADPGCPAVGADCEAGGSTVRVVPWCAACHADELATDDAWAGAIVEPSSTAGAASTTTRTAEGRR